MSGQHIGADDLYIPYRNRVAAGDVVRICDLDGTEFARGLSEFDATEIKERKLQRVEVVHRDNLVIL